MTRNEAIHHVLVNKGTLTYIDWVRVSAELRGRAQELTERMRNSALEVCREAGLDGLNDLGDAILSAAVGHSRANVDMGLARHAWTLFELSNRPEKVANTLIERLHEAVPGQEE
jgi:hypothetical protein